jgi:hypothetical protein
MVTGGHDVAEREDPVRQPIVLDDFRRDRHEGRIRERYADRLGLSAVGLPPHERTCRHEVGRPSRQNSQTPSAATKGATTR